jgi:hypothetical protein
MAKTLRAAAMVAALSSGCLAPEPTECRTTPDIPSFLVTHNGDGTITMPLSQFAAIQVWRDEMLMFTACLEAGAL